MEGRVLWAPSGYAFGLRWHECDTKITVEGGHLTMSLPVKSKQLETYPALQHGLQLSEFSNL